MRGSTTAGRILVLNLDQFDRVFGDAAILGDYSGDGLAHVPDFVDGDRPLVDRARRERRQRVHPLPAVLAGQHPEHAWQPLGGPGVDADNAGVRVRAAQNRGVRHPWQLEIVDEATLAAQQPRVFDSLDALADPAARAGLDAWGRGAGRTWPCGHHDGLPPDPRAAGLIGVGFAVRIHPAATWTDFTMFW